MSGCKGPITTFIVEPFVPHDQEYYLSITSERLGSTINFSECGGIEIEENWDKVEILWFCISFGVWFDNINVLRNLNWNHDMYVNCSTGENHISSD